MSERTTSEIAVHNRMSIPLFQPGKNTGPSIFSSGDMNVIVRTLRALTNPQIVWGERDDARLTDGNFLIQLSRTSSDPNSSRVRQFVLTDYTNGDYFIGRTVIRSGILLIGGEDTAIAKPFHLRQSLFDRAVLNVANPGNIGTVDEITYNTVVESWDGVTFSSTTKKWSYEYKSATFRIATDATDANPDNWTTQNQTIIPRFVPAVLDEPDAEATSSSTIAPTIICAAQSSGHGVAISGVEVPYLALSDGWAWSKTS